MASSDLSLEEIREYFLIKGGTVANREVVKHFKKHLTDPVTKDDARVKFKKYINTLATTRTDGTEKFLTLRPQYIGSASPSYQSVGIPRPQIMPTSPTYSMKDFHATSPSSSPVRQPPPYRPPPPVTSSPSISLDNVSMCSSNVSLQDVMGTPQAPPRNRSRTSIRSDSQESFDKKLDKERSAEEDKENVDKKPISVKERTQKFNRLASVEDELSPRQQKERKRNQERGADEDDGASVTSLDQKKCTEWLVTAAKGDYQDLAKLATDEPRLVKLRDPFTVRSLGDAIVSSSIIFDGF
ncbi:espin-like [Agrilus planipennis]|uniref:Espin-like n=1 Tax=Agrilus planipennis TaxID=224129 RepID=A0A1W4XAU7_AGRPL|nr:espin-like [Agrilus planipennis]